MRVIDAPSAGYAVWLRRQRLARFTMHATRIGLLALFTLAWEVLPRTLVVNPLFTSYPSALWPAFLDLMAATPQRPSLAAHTWATVMATTIGFTAAMALGVVIAVAFWRWETFYRVADPFLVVANAMPKTAFVPIFYVWLGAAASVYAMSLAISLFITILIIYNGFQAIDPNKIKLARTFGATKQQLLMKVVLPGSVPTLIAALKVNAGLSLVGVVVGEFQSANIGLGYLILYGSQIFKMDIVMTAIAILAVVSSIIYFAISRLEAAVMRRR